MSLTTQQLQTLKTYIASVPAWAALPNTEDAADFIANELNKPAVPAFIVRKSTVKTADIGPVLNYVAVSNLTTINRDRATTFVMLNPDSFTPTADVESYWDTTFNGVLGGQGQTTRDALRALWRRSATLGEKLYATGTGSDASPATLVVDGSISLQEVFAARGL